MSAHILLCEDEVPILKATEFKLKKAGFEVECAEDGQAAWEAIERRLPDLLITDLQMPRLNGYELTQRIRDDAVTASLPIIMLTAKGYELAEHDVVSKWGVVAVMTKPFSPRELLKLVEETVGGEEHRGRGAKEQREEVTSNA
jgi:two-component system, OmpR family, alkaline phosphatase synthesis response regulator PhoP